MGCIDLVDVKSTDGVFLVEIEGLEGEMDTLSYLADELLALESGEGLK